MLEVLDQLFGGGGWRGGGGRVGEVAGSGVGVGVWHLTMLMLSWAMRKPSGVKNNDCLGLLLS